MGKPVSGLINDMVLQLLIIRLKESDPSRSVGLFHGGRETHLRESVPPKPGI
jgi:hypothetical protein